MSRFSISLTRRLEVRMNFPIFLLVFSLTNRYFSCMFPVGGVLMHSQCMQYARHFMAQPVGSPKR